MLFTTLTAEVGKEAFCLRQGWRRQKSAFIWPRNKRQADLYAFGEDGGTVLDGGA